MMTRIVVLAAFVVFVVMVFLSTFYSFVGKGYWVVGVGPTSQIVISSKKTWREVITKGEKIAAPPFLILIFHHAVPPRDRLAIWLPDAQSEVISAGCDEPRNLFGFVVISNVYVDPQRLRARSDEREANKNINAVAVRCILYALLKPQGASLFLEKALSDTREELGQPELVRLRR